MNNVETRQVNRDSLFLLAELRLEGEAASVQVKVRNLSAGGMMVESDVRVTRDARVEVRLRNIGWTLGTVAWKQDNRFGIAFVDEIDPRLARAPIDSKMAEKDTSRRFRNEPRGASNPEKLRKI